MMEEDAYYDQVETYLDERMSEEEIRAFEQEVKKDPNLAKALASQRHARKVMAIDRRSSLVKELHDAESSHSFPAEEAPVRTLLNWKPYLAAAAVLLVLIAWALFLRPEGNPDTSLIAADAFEAYPATGTLMGQGSTTEKNAYAEGLAAYDDRDYEVAIEKLKQVPTQSPTYAASQLYLGNVYLTLAEPEPAIQALEAAQKAGDANLRETIQWYRALAYFSAGKEKKGRSLLENLTTTSSDIYGEKAKELLERME